MREKKLNELVLEEYGKRNIDKLELPAYIVENLSKELRGYQQEALRYFLAQRELYADKILSGNHLMFNMATGSGKTLMMAALMLECFKNGYRDFIFFVNSTAVLEKTKENFSNKSSSKYLFAPQIIVESQRVQINIIENLNESKKGCINIHFTTIQGLYSVLTKERENALSFLDFAHRKIVFLADEAHHLNSETKQSKKANQSEKESWESITTKAFSANTQNLMLEFTATIPKEKEVQEKYRDKIIYEYALKEFCQNGYAKRISLLKYESRDLVSRFLGGTLASLYRELLALEHKIHLKPVLLFKSESIPASKDNEEKFLSFLENLSTQQIQTFYVQSKAKSGEILGDSLTFFTKSFGQDWAQTLVQYIKTNFKKPYIMNANDDKEADKHQILLNSLEDSRNHVRVIFAVNKLNEGWDVLNLFDIVRLKDSKTQSTNATKTKKDTTTSEVQLIGRGARYYPFLESEFPKESRYKRKFDNNLSDERNYLERLSYHTINDVSFIKNLEQEMQEQGLLIEEELNRYELKLTTHAKQITQKYKLYYAKNERLKRAESLFSTRKITDSEINENLNLLKIPLFSEHISEKMVKFDKSENLQEDSKMHKSFSEVVDFCVFLKALNVLGVNLESLKAFENVSSKRDFYKKTLGKINLVLCSKQEIGRKNQLEIAKYVLQNTQKLLQYKMQEVEVSEFCAYELDLGERVVFVPKKNHQEDKIKNTPYLWLYYDKVPYDSDLELRFLQYIEGEKEHINHRFGEWVVIRNSGFSEFKIYDDRLDAQSFGKGFEPDFIFLAKERESEAFFALQCFMEVKGGYLSGDKERIGVDKWKEEFLKSLKGKKFGKILDSNGLVIAQNHLTLESLPFFTESQTFDKAFREFLESHH